MRFDGPWLRHRAFTIAGLALMTVTGSLPSSSAPAPPTVRISRTPDPADVALRPQPGQVAIEYIAHACFRIHTARGTRILIDPYASRVWIGYDFPPTMAADAVLITHPHYDHDAGVSVGRTAPWTSDVQVLRDPGTYSLADVRVTGIRGKHADPYGKEFGQKNTIWLIEVDGLRIAHLGDNGPLTAENVKELGRVDILMMPIDAKSHILKEQEVQAIRAALHPRVLIPMHYLLPDLEGPQSRISSLGPIDPWLDREKNTIRLESNHAIFAAGALLPAMLVVVFSHSPRVPAAGHAENAP